MSTSDLREEIHRYIDKVDDRVLQLIYGMLQADLSEENYSLSDSHKKVLDSRLEEHHLEPSSGKSWEETKKSVQG